MNENRCSLLHPASVMMLALLTSGAGCSNDTAPAVMTRHATTAGEKERVAAAAVFNAEYGHSQFAGWNVSAVAAGARCNVLLIHTSMVMDSSMVDAMHHGASEYAVGGSGVQGFYLQQTFRGVAYRDGAGRVWTYGAVNEAEVEALLPCG